MTRRLLERAEAISLHKRLSYWELDIHFYAESPFRLLSVLFYSMTSDVCDGKALKRQQAEWSEWIGS